MLYFNWANDDLVRSQSFYSDLIDLENHTNWFLNKIKDEKSLLYLFEINQQPVGQVRIEVDSYFSIIGISIDKNYRGKGLGVKMLINATSEYFKSNKLPIFAYIKLNNIASSKIFESAGFQYYSKDRVNNFECFKYILTN